MGAILKIFLLAFTLGSAYVLYQLLTPAEVPKIPDGYWGPGAKPLKEDEKITPFKINVDNKTLQDLKNRLKVELESKRFAPPLEGIGFEYGFNTKFLPKILTHWLEKYDWKSREKMLNKYPQFKTRVGGLEIHYQHVVPPTGKGRGRRPILLMHGWPGSFVEYQKVIPLLAENKEGINYEVI